MLCVACDKESTNQRVCPFCFTPYPGAGPASRASVQRPRATASGTAVPGPGSDLATSITNAGSGIGAFIRRQSPIVRWSGLGIVLVGLLWYFTGEDPRLTAPPGQVPANIISAPMQRDEALALIKQTREQALVEEQSGEVFVSYPAATFPELPEGRLALVQQFTRADALVEGRMRRISFYDPAGRVFAQSDGVKGVRLLR